MHDFSELSYRCTRFTLQALKNVEDKVLKALQTSGATSLVKTLQMVRLEKVILSVGMFSIFEAILQDRLNCNNGFVKAKEILKESEDLELLSQFVDLELAVNALKHGRGRSYDALIAKDGGSLSSNIKQPKQYFLDEGNVSEVTTLIDVDDQFIYSCVEVISQVTKSIKKIRPDVIF